MTINRGLDGILEVREEFNSDTVNLLLSEGNWKLLEVSTHKVTTTGIEYGEEEWLIGLLYEAKKPVPIVNEEQVTKYVLGRY